MFSFKQVIVVYLFTCICIGVLVCIPPARNTSNSAYFIVEQGQGLRTVSQHLGEQHMVRFPMLFSFILLISDNQMAIKAGTYAIPVGESTYRIAHRLVHAKYNITPYKVTITEGSNIFQMAEILADHLPQFDTRKFVSLAGPYEGLLFPDTYLLSPDMSEADIVDILRDTFTQKTKDLFAAYNISEDDIYETVTLASLVEEETHIAADRPIVAGVLRNRLEIGMLLQVDVTFQYINGKNSYNLTVDDLKDDSPYNTYVHTGLPPTPISNPGLDSIRAVLEYTKTDYLYFLSSKNGVMYYARTFEEHIANRKYL